MEYQLILQWSASDPADFDFLLQIEENLISKISKKHEIDGHDFGSGQMNVFILTTDPREAFREIKSFIGTDFLYSGVRIAYREEAKSHYVVLWPEDMEEFNVI